MKLAGYAAVAAALAAPPRPERAPPRACPHGHRMGRVRRYETVAFRLRAVNTCYDTDALVCFACPSGAFTHGMGALNMHSI